MSPPAVDGVCQECGYDYDALERTELAAAIRASVPEYEERLAGDASSLRAHTVPGVWSPLEYACHLRDVFAVQLGRIRLALEEDEPTFVSMRREERVTEEGYKDQDPDVVGRQLATAAEALAAELDGLDEPAWRRTGIYNYPAGQVRTVEWIGRHTLHEAGHHLFDIDRLLAG